MKNNIPEYVLGIDIGGTNTVAAIINTSGKIEFSTSILTTDHESLTDLMTAINDQITPLKKDLPVSAVGIGAPNGSSVSGCIEHAPNLKWKGVIEVVGLASDIFNCPVVLTNDANAAGIGECAWGNCRGYNHIIMLTIGTGLGCSIIANQKLIEGSKGFAGEFGHITAVKDGRVCKCGKKGCLEQYVSAQGIIKTYTELGGNSVSSVRDIFDYSDHSTLAKETLNKTAEILGLHLANLINILNPEAVCIAGGVAKSGEKMKKNLTKTVDEHILPLLKGNLKIHFSKLENQTAGVLGASYLAFDHLIKEIEDET